MVKEEDFPTSIVYLSQSFNFVERKKRQFA